MADAQRALRDAREYAHQYNAPVGDGLAAGGRSSRNTDRYGGGGGNPGGGGYEPSQAGGGSGFQAGGGGGGGAGGGGNGGFAAAAPRYGGLFRDGYDGPDAGMAPVASGGNYGAYGAPPPDYNSEAAAAERRMQESLARMSGGPAAAAPAPSYGSAQHGATVPSYSNSYAAAPAPAPAPPQQSLLSREDQEFRAHIATQIREALPDATDADIDEAFNALRSEQGPAPAPAPGPMPAPAPAPLGDFRVEEPQGMFRAEGDSSPQHTRPGYDPSKDPNQMSFGGSTSGQPPPPPQRQLQPEQQQQAPPQQQTQMQQIQQQQQMQVQHQQMQQAPPPGMQGPPPGMPRNREEYEFMQRQKEDELKRRIGSQVRREVPKHAPSGRDYQAAYSLNDNMAPGAVYAAALNGPRHGDNRVGEAPREQPHSYGRAAPSPGPQPTNAFEAAAMAQRAHNGAHQPGKHTRGPATTLFPGDVLTRCL